MGSKIIYYIATSIDGFIAGLNNDVSSFLYEGKGVEKYKADLMGFDTVLMGKNTYEVGLKFGLESGKKAYPGMRNYIFSNSLHLENCEKGVSVCKMDLKTIEEIRKTSSKNIYLCGGGVLAEWLLKQEQIDEVKIKVNPIVIGTGVKLFGGLDHTKMLQQIDHEYYDDGLVILNYAVIKTK